MPSAPITLIVLAQTSLFRSADAILPIEPSGPGIAHLAVLVGADVREPQHLGADPQLHHLVELGLTALGREVLERLDERADDARAPLRDRAADRDPLVHQRGQRHAPAVADRAEALAVGDPGVGEVHLVELGLARHLAQRPDVDGRVACMSTTNAVRPACLTASGSVRTTSRPHRARWASVVQTFWPLTTHSSPSRTPRDDEAGEVRPGAGLREQLAPDLLAREQRAEVALLLIVAAPHGDRRAAHAVADRVAVAGVRTAGAEDPLVDRSSAASG